MCLLNYSDLTNKTIVEIGVGSTFPSYNFYRKSKPKLIFAFEMRPLEINSISRFAKYIVVKENEKFILPTDCTSVDFLILSKVFNTKSEEESYKFLDNIIKINAKKIFIEEYNLSGKEFIGVDKLSNYFENIHCKTKIFRNARIFPERYYEGSRNIKHRLYNIFFCKRDVLMIDNF